MENSFVVTYMEQSFVNILKPPFAEDVPWPQCGFFMVFRPLKNISSVGRMKFPTEVSSSSWGYPHGWMPKGKSQSKKDEDWGVVLFKETPNCEKLKKVPNMD